MLTFELADNGERLEVHGDREGLRRLAEILTSLADEKRPDHAHLMTEDWGGSGLSNDIQGLNNTLLHHVKVFVWPKT
ncbi:Imm32 family immunity protein [Methylocaldum sp. GT1TLB]|jgi:uncharacterized protein YmfQ (DUF2313 family)|uniref:Imm32 family immunity protein n=1 Tax=Methylocaldum sp. GT1TLB TaxID=3438965 RepID=UPI003DA07053